MIVKLHPDDILDNIAHSLVESGICIWYGLPEHILENLSKSGYTISKDKNAIQSNSQA